MNSSACAAGRLLAEQPQRVEGVGFGLGQGTGAQLRERAKGRAVDEAQHRAPARGIGQHLARQRDRLLELVVADQRDRRVHRLRGVGRLRGEKATAVQARSQQRQRLLRRRATNAEAGASTIRIGRAAGRSSAASSPRRSSEGSPASPAPRPVAIAITSRRRSTSWTRSGSRPVASRSASSNSSNSRSCSPAYRHTSESSSASGTRSSGSLSSSRAPCR